MFPGGTVHFFVYLDEFGHIGQFISRNHPRFKTSPVFGLGGIALPSEAVRPFATFFFKLKTKLLAWELERDEKHPARWEKKGAALYTPKNVEKYRELRIATGRYLNKIGGLGGFAFFAGQEKEAPRDGHSSEALYLSVLKHSIRRLNNYCRSNDSVFSLFLDSVDSTEGRNKFRTQSVEQAGREMFGGAHCSRLVEPPYQLESHLYQTMQCADWICALIGRRLALGHSTEFSEYAPIETYFGQRLDGVLKAHSFRKKKALVRVLQLPGT